MRQLDDHWPPLIFAKSKSRLTTFRDLILTMIMWLAFGLMLAGEFELVLGPQLRQLGLDAYFERVGFGDLPADSSGEQFLRDFLPYLAMSLILVVSQLSFAFYAVARRRNALRGPPLPLLDPAIEARQAELATMAGHSGPALEARRVDLRKVGEINPRALLAALERLNEAALADARSLRVSMIQVTADGHYRIHPGM